MARHKDKEKDFNPDQEENTKLAAEDIDESKQSIEEAAYYIGLERQKHSHPGDDLTDWFEAERAVKENLD